LYYLQKRKAAKCVVWDESEVSNKTGETMPRGARLDVPGTLHHVMVRGTEGMAIVQDDEDREGFVGELGLSYAGAARILGISASGVNQILMCAREK
jgi:hypothetical protein